jgi:hypothetical protein
MSPIRGDGGPHSPRIFKLVSRMGEDQRRWALDEGPVLSEGGRSGTIAMDGVHLAASQRFYTLDAVRQKERARRSLPPEEDEEGIKNFFGQLWLIPKPRVIWDSHPHINFFWIRRNLWESKSLCLKDFIPVYEGDVLRADWKKGSFAADIWGKGELKSFLEVVRGEMANPGRGRGSGRGGRFNEDQWGGRGVGVMKNIGEELLVGGTKDFLLALSRCRRRNCSLLHLDSTLALPYKDSDRDSSLSLVSSSIRIPTSTSKVSDLGSIINRVRDRGLLPHQDRGRQ